jgi:phage terminase large subunit
MLATAAPPQLSPLDQYLALRQLWQQSPLTYVRDRFGVEPTWQQQEILDAIQPRGAKVSVRSGHGIGKSSCAAWAISWFVETHDFCKVPCTAPTAHQLRDILWGELSKWRRIADEQSRHRGDHPRFWLSQLFRLIHDSLIDPSAREWGAFARTAKKENPEALQGFHADHLLFVIDEGPGVHEEVFEAAEGALSTPGARVLMLGNPTRNTGTFAASHKHNRGDYTALHFRSQDSPLVDPGYRQRLVRKWGEGSNVVRVRADGEFPRQEDDILISLELTEPCLTRERREGGGLRKLGVDVAWKGGDRTTLVLRHGSIVDHIAVYSKDDTMVTVGHIMMILEAWQVDEICVDVIGLGAGVHNRLDELRRQHFMACKVVGVNVAEKPPQSLPQIRHPEEARPYRLRDYLWLEMKRWLQHDAPVFCPEDVMHAEDLAGELASVAFRPNSDGLLVIEEKDRMRTRLGHSPDLADALGCTFAPSLPQTRVMEIHI